MRIDHEFDVAFADALAAVESYNKHLYRPNTYLHKWWARRCGSTFRTILKHLVTEPAQQDYYAAGGLEGKIILDPMMGGGTTLHEAIRLGANVVGVDIDPIPVLQARATLTAVPLRELKHAFAQFYARLTAVLTPFYQTHCPVCETAVPLQFVLHGWRRQCACREALFLDSLILRHNSDGSTLTLDPQSHAILHNGTLLFAAEGHAALPLLTRQQNHCPDCGQPFREDRDLPYFRRYQPVVVVGTCAEHGRFFAPVRPFDRAAIAHADAQRQGCGFDAAHFIVQPGPKSNSLLARNVTHYLELFSSRQLLYLRAAIDALANLEPLAQLNLALLVSTSLEFNTLLCGYKGEQQRRPGAIRHAFAYHAYSFPYTAAENNPVYPTRASGTLQSLFHGRIVRGRVWAANPVERRLENGRTAKVTIAGEVDAGIEYRDFAALQSGTRRFLLRQGSSATLDLPDASVDAIVTDPPYYDSVQYGDLAAFFRVWLRQLLPTAVSWEYALDETAVDQRLENGQYGAVLRAIFAECRRVLKPDGRLIFTFHHWNPQGWAALTGALKQAGFALVNRYVVHAENLTSRHIVNQNALKHDVILVLAPAISGPFTAWPRPTQIRSTGSYEFCLDCGTAVGWLLQTSLTDQEVAANWQSWLASV